MCRSLTPKPHRQLRVRNLPKVPIGLYVAAKTGLKPTTFQTKGVESTNEPPCPTIISLQDFHCFIVCLLRHCSVLGFDCLLPCFFRHYTISSAGLALICSDAQNKEW